jgi:hypothetical protein
MRFAKLMRAAFMRLAKVPKSRPILPHNCKATVNRYLRQIYL